MVDNYDSFTFNLYQYCGEILNKKFKDNSNEVIVKRNNQLTLDDISKINPNRIIISPGPGSPDQKKYFGICEDIILKFGPSIPLLGICLGMQGIAHAFGAKIIQAKEPMHGKTSFLVHDKNGLHKNIPQNIEIMRYHSLIVDPKTLPDCFFVNAISKDEENHNITPDFTNLHFKNDIICFQHNG